MEVKIKLTPDQNEVFNKLNDILTRVKNQASPIVSNLLQDIAYSITDIRKIILGDNFNAWIVSKLDETQMIQQYDGHTGILNWISITQAPERFKSSNESNYFEKSFEDRINDLKNKISFIDNVEDIDNVLNSLKKILCKEDACYNSWLISKLPLNQTIHQYDESIGLIQKYPLVEVYPKFEDVYVPPVTDSEISSYANFLEKVIINNNLKTRKQETEMERLTREIEELKVIKLRKEAEDLKRELGLIT